MNRRGFLSTLAAATAGMVLDPERLLWVPGQKTIFLPPVALPPVALQVLANRIEIWNPDFRIRLSD